MACPKGITHSREELRSHTKSFFEQLAPFKLKIILYCNMSVNHITSSIQNTGFDHSMQYVLLDEKNSGYDKALATKVLMA